MSAPGQLSFRQNRAGWSYRTPALTCPRCAYDHALTWEILRSGCSPRDCPIVGSTTRGTHQTTYLPSRRVARTRAATSCPGGESCQFTSSAAGTSVIVGAVDDGDSVLYQRLRLCNSLKLFALTAS